MENSQDNVQTLPEQSVTQETGAHQAVQLEQPPAETLGLNQEVPAEQPAETSQVYTEKDFIADYNALCQRSGFELSFSSFPQFSPTNHGTFEIEVKGQIRVVRREVQQGQ